MVSYQDLERIGLEGVLEFLELDDKYELYEFMVDNDLHTLPLLARYISSIGLVCQCCFSELVPFANESLVCDSCYDTIGIEE